jgi:hypothetical protein
MEDNDVSIDYCEEGIKCYAKTLKKEEYHLFSRFCNIERVHGRDDLEYIINIHSKYGADFIGQYLESKGYKVSYTHDVLN